MHTSAYAHLGVKNEKLAQAVAGLQYVPNVIENLIYHYTAVSKRNKATTMALVRLSLRRVTGPFGSIARAKVAPSLKANSTSNTVSNFIVRFTHPGKLVGDLEHGGLPCKGPARGAFARSQLWAHNLPLMAGIHAYSSLTAEMPSIVGHGHRVSRCCSQPRGPAAGVAPARRRSVGQKYRVHSLPDFDEPDVSAQEDVRQPANGSSSSSRAGSAAMPSAAGLVKTRFIAETLLPTRNGRFRLRGYKHSVRKDVPSTARAPCGSGTSMILLPYSCYIHARPSTTQLDGGITFTEPTAIIYGEVEGKADVCAARAYDASLILVHAACVLCRLRSLSSAPGVCWCVLPAPGLLTRLLTACVCARVPGACARP